LKFSNLPVQSSHHCVSCAHKKKTVSHFFEQVANATSMQMIMCNYLLFPYQLLMSRWLKCTIMGLCWTVTPTTTFRRASLCMQNGLQVVV